MKKQQLFKLQRDKFRGETEIYHVNGFLLGRHELPIYEGQATRAYFIDSETLEVTEIGSFANPFIAGNKLIEVWESKAGEREQRKKDKYNDWLQSPLVSKMYEDFSKLNKSESDFMRFYRTKIYDYEEKYPELVV